MEAGYDYLLVRGRRHLFGFTAVFLVVFGAVLVAGGGAYYAYAAKARADLEQLNVSLPDPPMTDAVEPTGPEPLDRPVKEVQLPEPEAEPPPGISETNIANQRLHPAGPLTVGSWSSPLEYEPLEYREEVLLQGFMPMNGGQELPVGSQAQASRIMVPALGVDSSVNELDILDLGDSRAYETPARTVGHIPQSANPGEAGSSWFFGHLESPTLGEGSVFFHLPKISDMLRDGEDVFVIAQSGAHQYLYLITSTNVLHESEMRLYDNGEASIHLVACVPRLVYDHRIIVTGELVGVK